EALRFFRRAADFGEVRAYLPAAAHLDAGVGSPADPEAAARYLLLAVAADSGETLSAVQRGAAGFTRPTLMEVQRQLRDAGYYSGMIDGVIGPRTIDALTAWRAGRVG